MTGYLDAVRIREMEEARTDHSEYDEYDSGYELSDPKHPTFYDCACDHADWQRKAEKEGR